MNFIQYSGLGVQPEKGMLKRFPFACGWDKTFSKVLLCVCLSPLLIFAFQWAVTPIGELKLTKEPQIVNLGEIVVTAQEQKIEKEIVPQKVVFSKGAQTIPNLTGQFMSAVITQIEPIEDEWTPKLEKIDSGITSKKIEYKVIDQIGRLEGTKGWTNRTLGSILKEFERDGETIKVLWVLSQQIQSYYSDESERVSFDTFPERTRQAYLRDVATLETMGIERKRGIVPDGTKSVEAEIDYLGGWKNILIDVLLDRIGEDKVRRVWVKLKRK